MNLNLLISLLRFLHVEAKTDRHQFPFRAAERRINPAVVEEAGATNFEGEREVGILRSAQTLKKFIYFSWNVERIS